MTFSSLTFLFVFLPAFLLLHFLIPGKGKRVVLFIAGIVFYSFGDPKAMLFMLFSILLHYAAGLEISRFLQAEEKTAAKIAMLVTVAVDVAALAVFKYTSLALPLGISFYTFSAISYAADVYMGKAEAERNPLTLALYISFFPKVVSGPIVQYHDFRQQLTDLSPKEGDFGAGMYLFMIGLFKKVLLADVLGAAFASVTALPEMASATAILGMLFYSFQLYFDFSGYSDMAIGLARVAGFRFAKNFDYPYLSTSVAQFWRRWHISLGAWFRDYVYIPLGGNRCSALMQFRNLLIVWILTGIWHGNTWNFVVWGLYHGFFVIFERFVLKGKQEAIPAAIRVFVTDVIVFIGWVFFFSPSMGSAVHYLGQMIGRDGLGFWDSATTFIFRQNILVLILAVLFSGSFIRKWHDGMILSHGKGIRRVFIGVYIALLILCVAFMVGATYSSFLYVQF